MSEIIYTCPDCGNDLMDIMIATNPPIAIKECPSCGWRYEEKSAGIKRVPFKPEGVKYFEYQLTFDDLF